MLKIGFAKARSKMLFVWLSEGENGIGVPKNIITIQNIESIDIGASKTILTMQKIHNDIMMTQNIQHDQLSDVK